MKKLFLLALCPSLLVLTTCVKEISVKGDESAILLIPDAGDFRLNVLTQMSDGNILVAGTTTTYNSDGFQIGLDTGTFYLVDPNTHKVKKIEELSRKIGYVYAAIGTPDGGMIVHYEDFFKSTASIERFDKDFNTIASIYSDAYLDPDGFTVNRVNQFTRLKDGNYLLLSRNLIKKLDTDLNIIWQKNVSPISLSATASYLSETGDGSILAAGGSDGLLYIRKYLADGSSSFFKTNQGFDYYGSYYWDVVASGGKYLASGYSVIPSNENIEGIIVTYNENGDSLSHKIFATTDDDFGRKLIPTADGGYVFLMTRIIQNSTRAIRILKLDASLNTLWEKEVLKLGKSNTAPVGIKLTDGRIVVGCFGDAGSNTLYGMDASLIFLDKNGEF